MRTLLVLVGMQGSGKTTALQKVKNAVVLKPSTMRARREGEGDDYYFENEWNEDLFAWRIERNGIKYGMRHEELNSMPSVGVTVFDPAALEVLTEAKKRLDLEVITVGIDTIATLDIQIERVNHDTLRKISSNQDFETQFNSIRGCDVVLQGDEQVVADALNTIISIVGGRGGLLHDQAIKNLIKAGALLEDADLAQIQSASYDLRLADMYWCQGKFITLDTKNPIAEIPPYSYIFVQAVEHACLPRFMAADFDTTVSLFFNGIILSNGPQVDPGYKGALFCMLYNACDTTMGISRGKHFATIQFSSTVGGARGYQDQYQGKILFQDFIKGREAKSPGGIIFERLEQLKKELKGEVAGWRQGALAICALALAFVLALGTYQYNAGTKAEQRASEAEQRVTEAALKFEKLIKNAPPLSNTLSASNPSNSGSASTSTMPDAKVVSKSNSAKQ